MKRLTRTSANVDSVDDALHGVSNDAREVLKQLEKLKFKTMQCTRLTSNNDGVSKKVMQNADILDKVMSALYSVCFNIDNIDLTPLYDSDQLKLNGDQGFNLGEQMPETEEPKKDDVTEEVDETKTDEKSDKSDNNDVTQDEPLADSESVDEPTDENVDEE